ncbi:MAG: F420-dependent NADP oxidoreductase [Pseudooceanicola sp.]|nr:F420-dependent NADP oxidoreductase [Pseudooceanicola sp.]|tara:strand:+ start:2354 stop:3049 length:696 start_codon:yes stop_codon:yes gene_type:complete
MKKIGIIGTGNMGRTIGLSLARKGYEVFFGGRDLSKAAFAASFDNTTKFGSNQEAAEFGDIIYYSPRDIHPKNVINNLSALKGKVVIESSNWNLSSKLEPEKINISKAEILQHQLPEAMVVKAFNTIIQEVFEYTIKDIDEYTVTCFIASNFEDAIKQVSKIVYDLGFKPEVCGNIKQALLLEEIGSLIRILARLKKTPWLSLSVSELPIIEDLQFGGRTPSILHGPKDFN